MKKASLFFGSILAVGLSLAAWHTWGPRHTPPGQAPLAALRADNFSQLQQAFNAGPASVRLVLLFSPT